MEDDFYKVVAQPGQVYASLDDGDTFTFNPGNVIHYMVLENGKYVQLNGLNAGAIYPKNDDGILSEVKVFDVNKVYLSKRAEDERY